MLRSSPCADKAEEEMQAVEHLQDECRRAREQAQGAGGAASLMVFLDANPVIYLIEQPANLGSKVTTRVSDLLSMV